MERFCEAVAAVLEVESIGPDDDFRAVPDWCSLKAFGLLVTLENDWQTPLTIERFQTLKTVRDLWSQVSRSLASSASCFPSSSQSVSQNDRHHEEE